MVLHKADLAKSNDYFREIHPAEAAAVDAARAEEQRKAQAKKAAAPRSSRQHERLGPNFYFDAALAGGTGAGVRRGPWFRWCSSSRV